MTKYKLLQGYLHPRSNIDITLTGEIPEDHYIINISQAIYSPYTFDIIKIVYYKHRDINIDRIHKMYIGQEHPLWNWQNQNQ